MKKKTKIILIIVGMLVLASSIFFAVSYKVAQNPKNVIKNEVGNNQKYTPIEDVPFDYNFADMVEDKCYIVMPPNIVYHIKELNNFIENVNRGISDEIMIIEYTKEEQPILTNLKYIDNKFILKVDNRRDGYAKEEDKKIITKEYDANKYELVKSDIQKKISNITTYYQLDLKSKEADETITICNYADVKKLENERFKIVFNKDESIDKSLILGRDETNKYDYDIYSYKGTVDIIINEEKISLRDALINDKITVEEILEKANKDAREDKTIFGSVYLDGGSSFYIYDDYEILKCHKLSSIGKWNPGYKDLYIGVPSMVTSSVLDPNSAKLTITMGNVWGEEKKTVTLNDEDTSALYQIIQFLEFKKETCDGLSNYYISLNSETENNLEQYGLETYESAYHITAKNQGEAILSEEQRNIVKQIINKYFN